VICTSGARESLLDELILPGIFEQPLGEFEVVVVGPYAGRHRRRVTVVEAEPGGELFYKPFQLGVSAATQPWIADLDDDVLLDDDWGRALGDATPEHAGVYGFRMLNPDGTLFGTYFDAVDNRRNGRRTSTSYFHSYLAPTDVFRQVAYPTYQSGDRAHALQLRSAYPTMPWRLLPGAKAIHLGQSMRQPGLVPKTTLAQIADTRPLLRFLNEHRIAWIPFAERCLEGRSDVTVEDAWSAARRAVGDPDLAQREHWLR
jgi:hypothetical protein